VPIVIEGFNNMTKKEAFLDELDHVPESIIDEVLDYIRFLKSKNVHEYSETTLLNETSLKKDWLKPKEDEAWKDL
jgi:hypothetical protein